MRYTIIAFVMCALAPTGCADQVTAPHDESLLVVERPLLDQATCTELEERQSAYVTCVEAEAAESLDHLAQCAEAVDFVNFTTPDGSSGFVGGPFGHVCEDGFFDCLDGGEPVPACWELVNPCLVAEHCEHLRAICVCSGAELESCETGFDACSAPTAAE